MEGKLLTPPFLEAGWDTRKDSPPPWKLPPPPPPHLLDFSSGLLPRETFPRWHMAHPQGNQTLGALPPAKSISQPPSQVRSIGLMNTEPEGFSGLGILLARKEGRSPYLLGILRCQMPHVLHLTSPTVTLPVFLTTESPRPSRTDTR